MVDEMPDVVTREVLRAEVAGVDVKLAGVDVKLALVDVKIAELRAEVHEGFRRQQGWLIATALSAAGVFLTGIGAAVAAAAAFLFR
jgi:hypothetical protein